MLWQSFAWVILAFQDPPTIALLASSRCLFNRSVNRVTAVDSLILPTIVWGRLSKRGQDGDARLNTIHGRYAHTASGIKMLWMSNRGNFKAETLFYNFVKNSLLYRSSAPRGHSASTHTAPEILLEHYYVLDMEVLHSFLCYPIACKRCIVQSRQNPTARQ